MTHLNTGHLAYSHAARRTLRRHGFRFDQYELTLFVGVLQLGIPFNVIYVDLTILLGNDLVLDTMAYVMTLYRMYSSSLRRMVNSMCVCIVLYGMFGGMYRCMYVHSALLNIKVVVFS